jgi:hypothetical protein
MSPSGVASIALTFGQSAILFLGRRGGGLLGLRAAASQKTRQRLPDRCLPPARIAGRTRTGPGPSRSPELERVLRLDDQLLVLDEACHPGSTLALSPALHGVGYRQQGHPRGKCNGRVDELARTRGAVKPRRQGSGITGGGRFFERLSTPTPRQDAAKEISRPLEANVLTSKGNSSATRSLCETGRRCAQSAAAGRT